MNRIWMKSVLAALLGAIVLAGCGSAEMESATSTNNAAHKEGDGHDHKPGETH